VPSPVISPLSLLNWLPAIVKPENFSANPATIIWPSRRPTRLADALFLGRLVLRFRPDCLVANFAAVNWMCIVGWLLRVKHRIAFYHTLSTQLDRDSQNGRKALGKFSWFRKKLVYKTATCIVGNSEAALLDAQAAFGIPAKKCKLWQYSMPDPAARFNLVASGEREDLLVCAGRLSPSKGQDVLLAALQLALTAATSTKVEFLGSGPNSDQLRRVAQERGLSQRCAFRGLVSNEEVLKRMSRAQITVVPSRNEAFGLVNVESMSVGTPVIASRVDGIPEIVRDGLDGYLVAPDDPRALAEKLTLVLRDLSLRERLGSNARQRFLDKYENQSVVHSQASWLQQVLRPSKC
jgi:glycosyltransferase involved in cell wall biosynthesis